MIGLVRSAELAVVNHHSATRLQDVFQRCFATGWRTRLQGGAAEPLYQPAAGHDDFHTLYYREDYFASALHEVAHWCIAGAQRRLQPDFGYWYAPDGRTAQQQEAFQAAEIKPQALEWFFTKACGLQFQVSLDNLAGDESVVVATHRFQRSVVEQTRTFSQYGLPERADQFFCALTREFGTDLAVETVQFSIEELTR